MDTFRFDKRFENILEMDIPEWVLDHFSSTEPKGSSKLDEELIVVTKNEKLKLKFKEEHL